MNAIIRKDLVIDFNPQISIIPVIKNVENSPLGVIHSEFGQSHKT